MLSVQICCLNAPTDFGAHSKKLYSHNSLYEAHRLGPKSQGFFKLILEVSSFLGLQRMEGVLVLYDIFILGLERIN